MTLLESFSDRLEGMWIGEGLISPSPWSKGGPVAVTLDWQRLKPSTTVIVRCMQRHSTDAPFESVTALSLTDPPRVWAFDTLGFAPDEPGQAIRDGDALVLERRSARGTNRTRYALHEQAGSLALEVSFVPAGAAASPVLIATATLKRRTVTPLTDGD